jgi:hypothetical protein
MSTQEVSPTVYKPSEPTSELRKRLKATARAAAIPQPIAGVHPVEINLIDEDPINPGFQSPPSATRSVSSQSANPTKFWGGSFTRASSSPRTTVLGVSG